MDNKSEKNDDLLAEIRELRERVAELEQFVDETKHYRHIVNTIAEGILLMRVSDRTILYTNPAFDAMFGYDKGELIGQHISVLNSPEMNAPMETTNKLIEKIHETGYWRDKILNISKQGQSFWCFVEITPFHYPTHGDVWLSVQTSMDNTPLTKKHKQETSLYHSLVNTMPYFVYRIDTDGRITFVNRALQESFNLSAQEILGKTAYDFYLPRLANKYRQDDQTVLNTGEVFTDIEININPVTGITSHVKVTKIPIYDKHGKITGIQGVFEDISEQVQTQEKLEKSRNTLRDMIQQMPVGIQIFNSDGLCIEANDALLDIFGSERDNIVGVYNIFEDTIAENIGVADAAQRALQGETVYLGDVEFDFSRAYPRFADTKQKTKILAVTLFPILNHDDRVSGFVGLNVDITERKMMENRLRMNEQRYRGIVEDQHELITRFLPDGTYTFVNQAFCEFFGGSKEDYINTRWDIASRETLQTHDNSDIIALNKKLTGHHSEVQYTRKDGEQRWISWIDRAIGDEDNRIVEFQSIGIDVTEKKNLAEQQFKQALEQERINILSDFVIRAAHEFRTPLSIINSSAYAMSRYDDAGKRDERLKKINKQVRRITGLLDSMIMMSRIDSTPYEAEQGTVNINSLLEIVYTRAKSISDTSQRLCELKLESHALLVDIKARDFTTAIEAICNNALQYTEDDDSIHITSTQDGDYALVTVHDTGKGIREEDLPHIFERFYSSNYTGKTPGMGLGLPIAKALLKRYDADIEVNSEPDKGTTVTVKLKLIT